MRKSLVAATSMLLIAAVAGVTATVISAPSPVAAPTVTAADSYTVDSVHSFVVFRIKHNGVSYAFGRFNDISGSFAVDNANPANVSFDVTVKAESVDTGNGKRDDHLRSPDFFNARQFPVLTFKSTKVDASGTDSFNVTGDLTLHGVTKSVTVPMNLVGVGESRGSKLAGYETKFTIKRSEFGMDTYIEGGGLGDEVTIAVSLEGRM